MSQRTPRGFTLLEMIITILVIAVLAVIAIPTFNLVQERSLSSSLSGEADLLVRNANALAFSESGADLSPAILQDAVNETYQVNPPSVSGGQVQLDKIAGNRQCAIIVAIVNGKGMRGEPTCTADGTPPAPLAPS